MRIRTHGDENHEHERPGGEHARSTHTEPIEVCDMRHAIAPHSSVECTIMRYDRWITLEPHYCRKRQLEEQRRDRDARLEHGQRSPECRCPGARRNYGFLRLG